MRLKVVNSQILKAYLVDDLTETEMLALFDGYPPNGWKLLSVPVYAPGTSFDILV